VFHVVLEKGIGTVTYVMSVLAADDTDAAPARFGKRARADEDE
jgi:hypothetical protein